MLTTFGASILVALVSGMDDEVFMDGFETPGEACPGESSGLIQAYVGHTYDTIFAPFGQPSGQVRLDLFSGEFASFRLDIPTTPDEHRILWDETPDSPGSMRIGVSSCPGSPDMDDPTPDSDCYVQGSGRNGGLTLSSLAPTLSGICYLQPGQTYWLNISFLDINGTDTCECMFALCSCEVLFVLQ